VIWAVRLGCVQPTTPKPQPNQAAIHPSRNTTHRAQAMRASMLRLTCCTACCGTCCATKFSMLGTSRMWMIRSSTGALSVCVCGGEIWAQGPGGSVGAVCVCVHPARAAGEVWYSDPFDTHPNPTIQPSNAAIPNPARHRANEAGEDPLALSARFIDEFHRDMQLLGCLSPTVRLRFTDCLVRGLVGAALRAQQLFVRDCCGSCTCLPLYQPYPPLPSPRNHNPNPSTSPRPRTSSPRWCPPSPRSSPTATPTL